MTRKRGREPSQRQLRVGEELRHVLARLLRGGELRDPELARVNLTVTEVRVSPDLRNATAFVVPLGGVGGEAAVKALRRAQPHIRRRVAAETDLRFVPEFRFELDRSFDAARRVQALLHSPGVERDIGRPGEPARAEPEDES